jgi:CheY-like chemotaxis protein
MKQPLCFLLADDDDDDRALFAGTLLQVLPGVLVDTVNDGTKAIQYLDACSQENLPCSLILDLNMPQMDGFMVLDWINARPRFRMLTRFVLSTSADPEDKKKCLDKGVVAYYIKPNSIQGIIDIAEKIIAYQSAIDRH